MAHPPSTSQSSTSTYVGKRPPWGKNRDNFIDRMISPAILGKSCPICLETLSHRRAAVITVCKHAYCLVCIRRWSGLKRNCPLCNALFDSWFYMTDLTSRKFFTEKLPPLSEGRSPISQQPSNYRNHRRQIHPSGGGPESSSSRSRPLPWRRSFGRPGSVPADVIFERKLQWRAGVYARHLQAVPISGRSSMEQSVSWNFHTKERISQELEPWIRRELQAILGDPDPSIIVHVVSSLFIASLERKLNQRSGLTSSMEDELSPLRQFLHNNTEMFWNELWCFAESSLTMETYDSVVEYTSVGLDAERGVRSCPREF